MNILERVVSAMTIVSINNAQKSTPAGPVERFMPFDLWGNSLHSGDGKSYSEMSDNELMAYCSLYLD